jgi:aminopeptidase N
MYDKGSNILHTLRQITNDDEKWRQVLRGLNNEFYHQTVTTTQVENYISKKMKMDLKPFFDQYLRDVRIPVLEHYMDNEKLFFKWNNVIDGFNMPLKIILKSGNKIIYPTKQWKFIEIKDSFKIDNNYYVDSKHVIK